MTSRHERLPSALLFTRGESSVHMEVIERPYGLRVIVRGPGRAVAEYEFAEAEQLLTFTREKELELLAAGFQLQASAERRSGFDRREGRRQGKGDRRR